MKKDLKKMVKSKFTQVSQTKKSFKNPVAKRNKHEDLGEDLTMDEEADALKKPSPKEEL